MVVKNKFVDRLLNTEEAATLIGLSPDTLRWWRVRNRERGPRYFKLHQHAVRYSRKDLQAWLDARRGEDGEQG